MDVEEVRTVQAGAAYLALGGEFMCRRCSLGEDTHASREVELAAVAASAF